METFNLWQKLVKYHNNLLLIQIASVEQYTVYMLQVKIKFGLKFFNLSWFSIQFVS